MVDSPAARVLRERLKSREGIAEDRWRSSLRSLGWSDERVNDTLQRIGQDLTWDLWNIAIDEVSGMG